MYQALYRKWRPRTFDEVVGQTHITETLKRQAAEKRLSHAYLFTGSRGTGKTTCAKILARAANCTHLQNGNPCNACPACRGIADGSILDVLELDAASNNGVDQVRALREEAVYSPASVQKRVYIIDEVHMLSISAFNALLKILEEPPQHLLFILATTELHKVPATIQSRCQQFAFQRIPTGEIAARLREIALAEHIPLTSAGASLLARLADGGLRDALSLLDQCALGGARSLDERAILDLLGLAGNWETAALMQEIAVHNTSAALQTLHRLCAAGKDVSSLLQELTGLARDLLLLHTAPQGGTALLTGGYDTETLQNLSGLLPAARLVSMLHQLQAVCAGFGRSANRRVDAELCLIRLCDETLDTSPAGLLARIVQLEEKLAQGVPFPSPPTSSEPAPHAPSPPERVPPSEPSPAHPDPRPQDATICASWEQEWAQFVHSLQGRIPQGEFRFLDGPYQQILGTRNGATWTLWAASDFIKRMFTKPGILATLERTAKTLSGDQARVIVTIGTPPVPPAAPNPESNGSPKDKMDDLAAAIERFPHGSVED